MFGTKIVNSFIVLDGLWTSRKVKIDIHSIKSCEKVSYSKFFFNRSVYNLHYKKSIRFFTRGNGLKRRWIQKRSPALWWLNIVFTKFLFFLPFQRWNCKTFFFSYLTVFPWSNIHIKIPHVNESITHRSLQITEMCTKCVPRCLHFKFRRQIIYWDLKKYSWNVFP